MNTFRVPTTSILSRWSPPDIQGEFSNREEGLFIYFDSHDGKTILMTNEFAHDKLRDFCKIIVRDHGTNVEARLECMND
jgi:hypothetical protein